MKQARRNTLKIVSAVSITIFSLMSLTLGIYAWFASAFTYSQTADVFEVTTVGDCTLSDVNLYKFVYPKSTIHDGYDYLRPQDGTVKKYDFNDEEEHFGYYDEQHHNWVNVSAMNVYDPVELIISSEKSLIDLNCNAIYEISFASSYTNCTLDLKSLLRNDVVAGENEILLSECVDFDVFLPSDLADNNPLFYNEESEEYDAYYPSYKDNLTDLEKDYYKISYLSSLIGENNHHNFYSSNPKPPEITLYDEAITIEDGQFKVYVNANYAPKRLEQYAKSLYLHNIYALYDFGFEIELAVEAEG